MFVFEKYDDNVMLNITHKGEMISFSILDLPEHRREWLADILDRQFCFAIDCVESKTTNKLQRDLRKLIGL